MSPHNLIMNGKEPSRSLSIRESKLTGCSVVMLDRRLEGQEQNLGLPKAMVSQRVESGNGVYLAEEKMKS